MIRRCQEEERPKLKDRDQPTCRQGYSVENGAARSFDSMIRFGDTVHITAIAINSRGLPCRELAHI